MLKKRLIFILFFQDGIFHLSRNFTLQKVGDSNWLIEKFKFLSIGDFIDELVVLDVSRDRENIDNIKILESSLKIIMKELFVPLTIGGGINNLETARKCFEMGADKILLNTSIICDQDFVKECVTKFGSQAIVGSIDVRKKAESYETFIKNGTELYGSLTNHLKLIEDLKLGEVLINNIDRDGTGVGFDLSLYSLIPEMSIPIIISGGAGKPEHFSEALLLDGVSAVGTGNLFNFIGTGFENARNHLSSKLTSVRKI